MERLNPIKIICEGGLDLRQSLVTTVPGSGVELQNFEPNLHGGYRRINGIVRLNGVRPGCTSHFLPLNYYLASEGASTNNVYGQTKLLAVLVFDNNIYAIRATNPATSPLGGVRIFKALSFDEDTVEDLDVMCRDVWELIYRGGESDNLFVIPYDETHLPITAPNKIRFTKYNWTGEERVIITGATGTYAQLLTTEELKIESILIDTDIGTPIDGSDGSVAGPIGAQFITEHKRHIFYAGYEGNEGAIRWCVPNSENDFDSADGAGELVVGDRVTGLIPFREDLIIFCANSIHRLTGSSLSDFAVKPITKQLGCIVSDSIQEVNGDIIYLGADGFRTVAATERIGDFELGSISQQINQVIRENSQLIASANAQGNVCSIKVPGKNQYRLFVSTEGTVPEEQLGFIGAFRMNSQGQSQWEWSTIRGISACCADRGQINGAEVFIHGGLDDIVYKQEYGIKFEKNEISRFTNSSTNLNDHTDPYYDLERTYYPIHAMYHTSEMDWGDPGLRKFVHRVVPYMEREGKSEVFLEVHYDFHNEFVLQPDEYLIDETITNFGALYGTAEYDSEDQYWYLTQGPQPVYGEGIYGTDIYTETVHRTVLVERIPVQGTGFFVSLEFTSNDVGDHPYTIEGLLLEAQAGGKR